MKIACLGWGSLVWDPRGLPIRKPWFIDGPLLPIEFARCSEGNQITLVLVSEANYVRSLWTLMSITDLQQAKKELADREGIKKEDISKYVGHWSHNSGPNYDFVREIGEWAVQKGLDAVVWTALPPKFKEQPGKIPTADEVVSFLRKLSYERKLYAEEYIRKAHRQIDTDYRRKIEAELHWTSYFSKSSPKINDEFYDIEKRIDVALSAVDMNKKRAMILICYPDIPTKLKTIFSSKPGSLKSILESPPKIRESGFGLRVFGKTTIIGGTFCRVTGGKRKVIDLYKDGVLIVGLEADEKFLCWMTRDLIFNPVALIESIYNFVQLYERVIHDMTEKPNKISFRIDLRNLHLDNKKNKLAIGDLENIEILDKDEIRDAPQDSWSYILEVELEDFVLSRAANDITEMIYNYFGLDIEDIPYTKEIDGLKSIDIEQIK